MGQIWAKIQRIELGLPTEIGEHEVGVKNRYDGVSDEELIAKIEELTAKYKQSLLLRNKDKSRQQGLAIT